MISAAALRQVPFAASLGSAGQRALAAGGVERRFAPGEVLFLAGAASRGLFVVTKGRIRVLRAGSGRQHLVHVEGPGGTLGEVPLFDGQGYPATAVAATRAACLVFPPDVVRDALRTDPALAWALLGRLAARVRLLVEELDRRSAQPVGRRLAGLLLAMARARVIELGMTQTELAEAVGTVREVVVRELRRLKRAGVIRSAGRGRLELLDREGLEKRAG